MKHFSLKIAAILGALTLWFFVVAGKTYSVDMELDLRIAKLSPNLAIASHVPRSILVSLEGQGIDLIRLRSKDSLAWMELDLSQATLGKQSMTLTEANFRTLRPSNIRIKAIQAANSIELELDSRIHREIPIRIRQDFEIKSGYLRIGEPIAIPATIKVWGARKVLTRIYEIPTQALPNKEWKQVDTVDVRLDLSAIPPQAHPEQIPIRIAMNVQKIATREFSDIPVQLVGSFQRGVHSLEPRQAKVSVTGGEQIIRTLKSNDIQLFVEFSRFSLEGTDSLVPTLTIPVPIQDSRFTPSHVRLKVTPYSPIPINPL